MHNGIFIAAVPACKHSVISGFENMETEKSESTLLALFQKPTNSQETRITFFFINKLKKKRSYKSNINELNFTSYFYPGGPHVNLLFNWQFALNQQLQARKDLSKYSL